ncbi:MAG: hypothetical protein ACXW5U_02565 [Thermoanaerobaculia bacterium]
MRVQDRDRARWDRTAERRVAEVAMHPRLERERAVGFANEKRRALALESSIATLGEKLVIPEERLRGRELHGGGEQQREHAAASQS